MAEWLKAHAWKACKRETVSRVRIPLSPPFIKHLAQLIIYNKMEWSSYGRQQMKKFLVSIIILVLSMVNLHALTQDEAINSFLKDRDLEPIEGIWLTDKGTVSVIYKQGSSYIQKIIRSGSGLSYSGQHVSTFQKGSDNYFYGDGTIYWQYKGGFWGDKLITESGTCSESLNLISFARAKGSCGGITSGNISISGYNYSKTKIYPKSKSKAKKSKNDFTPSSGTAFFVTDKGHLITNNHVIEGCKDKSKIVYKDKEYPAKLIAKDRLLDFALLKAEISRNRFIVLSDDPPKKLQRIIAAGYPLGKYLSDDLKFTSGIISSLKGMDDDSTLIQIDAALNKGNSGGPIVNEETGELVAVAVAGLRKDKTEAVNFGIKTNSLKNFLDANQIKTTGSKMLFSFGNADVSNILEESTVYTFCK